MKILHFLTSKAGKLVVGAPQMLTIAGVGLMATYGAFKTDQILDKDTPIRTLSSVSASSSYEGLNRRADGMLSSMNIQNREGSKGVAVGADRERLEGTRSKNDFGLTAVDNLGRTVSVPGAGTAAATSATDGLGSGGVDMVEISGGSSSGRASVPGVSAASVAQGTAGGQASAGDSSGARLASASMARASGNAFNAASGSMGGGSVGALAGGRGGASGSRASGSDGYQFSGAMPSGSNVVSAHSGLSGVQTGPSHFVAGGRNASVGRGGRRVNETDDLKKISKMSADVAKDRNRGVVSGAKPFLANSATTAGMSIESGVDTTNTGSADFATPESRKLKAIGDWGQKQENTAKARSKARTRLLWMTLALVAAALGTMAFAGGLIFKGHIQMLMGQSMMALPLCKTAGAMMMAKGRLSMALGWGAIGLAGAYALTVLGFAIDYMRTYGGGFMPILSTMVSLGAVTALTLTGVKAMKAQAFSTDIAKFQGQVLGVLKQAGVAGGSTIAQQVISKAASE